MARANVNDQLLASMNDLSQAIKRLGDHQRDPLTAAVNKLSAQMERQAKAETERTNAASRDARGQGLSQSLPGQVRFTSGQISPTASTPDKAAQAVTQHQLTQQAEEQQQRTNVSGSVPGGGPESSGNASDTRRSGPFAANEGNIMTWAMLQGHGGPAGQLAMRQYSLEKNLGLAQGMAGLGQKHLGATRDAEGNWTMPDDANAGPFRSMASSVLGTPATAVRDAEGNVTGMAGGGGLMGLTSRIQNSDTAQLGIIGAGAAARGFMHLSNRASQLRNTALDLGYGGPDSAGLGFLGRNNPFAQSRATEEGASLRLTQAAAEGLIPGMGFGAGMTRPQAGAAIQSITGQGFSNDLSRGFFHSVQGGDATNIMQGLYRPLVAQTGDAGVGAATEFLPGLRNAGASIDQLRQALTSLAGSSQQLHENFGQLATDTLQASNAMVAMGAYPGQATQTAAYWAGSTGTNPQYLNAIQQSPMFSGLMMGQHGLAGLPGANQALGSGAQANTAEQVVRMYANLSPNFQGSGAQTAGGVTLPGTSGAAAKAGFISKNFLPGVPANVIQQLLDQGPSQQVLNQIQGRLGDPGQGGVEGSYIFSNQALGSNIPQAGQEGQAWAQLSPQRRQAASQYFGGVVNRQNLSQALANDPTEQADINGILGTSNTYQQVNRLHDAMAKAQGRSPDSQALTGKLNVTFTGPAANIFKQDGPGMVKLMQNAGGAPTNVAANSPLGDLPNAGNFSLGGLNNSASGALGGVG